MIQQGDIFQPLTHNGAFAELCTALYERELQQLALQPASSAQALQRRLQSVPYYVQQAARRMLTRQTPLTLDEQNASWQAPQKNKLSYLDSYPKKLQSWFNRQAKLGVAVPVFDLTPTLKRVWLDSVDRVDREQQRLHLNQFGWFDLNGQCLEPQSEHLRLAAPAANTMTPALCGHQWNHKGRTEPRTLSLREILLATTSVWD